MSAKHHEFGPEVPNYAILNQMQREGLFNATEKVLHRHGKPETVIAITTPKRTPRIKKSVLTILTAFAVACLTGSGIS